MPDTGSASGDSSKPSEGTDYPLRRRNEPARDEEGLTDSTSLILKELRLLKKELASNRAEFDQRLNAITEEIRSASGLDTGSSARTATTRSIERTNAEAMGAQPEAGTPETGEMVIPLGVMEMMTSISKWRQKQFRNVSK